MSATIEPRYPNSEVRQNRDRLVGAGYVYAGTRSDGHHDFIHPDGNTFVLSGTPASGQTTLVKDHLRKHHGIGQRGKFDRDSQRARQSAIREAEKALAGARMDEADRRELIHAAVQSYESRHRELHAISGLMGMDSYSRRLL